MKRGDDFLCHRVASRGVVVPVGAAAVRFSGMIDLNDTGAFCGSVWRKNSPLNL